MAIRSLSVSATHIGPDAEKAAFIGAAQIGDFFFADDTGLMYRKSVAGAWMLINVGSSAVYNSVAPTLTDGQTSALQLDVNGNLKTTLGTLLAGEDLTRDRIKVEQANSFVNITTNTTTPIKSGAGHLHGLFFGTPVATGVITVYDNTAGSGTIITKLTIPANPQPFQLIYDVDFATGLTIVTGTAAQDLTVSYR